MTKASLNMASRVYGRRLLIRIFDEALKNQVVYVHGGSITSNAAHSMVIDEGLAIVKDNGKQGRRRVAWYVLTPKGRKALSKARADEKAQKARYVAVQARAVDSRVEAIAAVIREHIRITFEPDGADGRGNVPVLQGVEDAARAINERWG